MRKLILAITLFLLFLSCDKIYYNKLYIINNCEETVSVSITNTWDVVNTFSVEANTTFMYNEGQGILSPKKMVESSYVKFEVTKNGVMSKVNYRDFNKWIYIEKEDKYHSELFLHINPEDFK
jgi:hypothetical protein